MVSISIEQPAAFLVLLHEKSIDLVWRLCFSFCLLESSEK